MIGILNNEALGLISIQSALTINKQLNIANVYLIAPLLFDKKIRGYLKRKNTKILSLQELVTSKNEYFIGFDDKLTDTLIVTTNAIAMGLELGLFALKGSYLIEIEQHPITSGGINKKVSDIIMASENVSKILSEPPESIYSLLRIKL